MTVVTWTGCQCRFRTSVDCSRTSIKNLASGSVPDRARTGTVCLTSRCASFTPQTQRKGRESNPQGSSLARFPSGSRHQSGSPSKVCSHEWTMQGSNLQPSVRHTGALSAERNTRHCMASARISNPEHHMDSQRKAGDSNPDLIPAREVPLRGATNPSFLVFEHSTVDRPGSRTPISWVQTRRLSVGPAAHQSCLTARVCPGFESDPPPRTKHMIVRIFEMIMSGWLESRLRDPVLRPTIWGLEDETPPILK